MKLFIDIDDTLVLYKNTGDHSSIVHPFGVWEGLEYEENSPLMVRVSTDTRERTGYGQDRTR